MSVPLIASVYIDSLTSLSLQQGSNEQPESLTLVGDSGYLSRQRIILMVANCLSGNIPPGY